MMTIKFKPVDLMGFGCRRDLPKLNEFWFNAREWNRIGHEKLLEIAGTIGFAGLHAAEGGFDDNPYGNRFDDARYGRMRTVMRLWKCGMDNHRFWILRLIFRLCEIATFDTERECVEYMKKNLRERRKRMSEINLGDLFG